MTARSATILRAWEEAGARVAVQVGARVGALVVLGKDPELTAQVALGLARAIATERQVAVADLLGESAALDALVPDTTAPGIADSFVHGVSLNAVARPVPGVERLFILPSGGIEAAAPHVLASTRWDRLARGFRQVDALLIIAASADEPEAEGLARRLGGAVAVGTAVVFGPDVPTLATAMAVLPTAPPRAEERAVVAETTEERVPTANDDGSRGPDAPDAASDAASRPTERSPSGGYFFPDAARPSSRMSPRRLGLLLGAVAVAAVAFFLTRDAGGPDGGAVTAARPESVATPPVDTLVIDTTELTRPPDADSATATPFAVELLSANTLDGAMLALRDTLPAGTVAPVLLGPTRARWFRVVAGAYRTRREVDSLLADLTRRAKAAEGAARIIQAPLAFRLEAAVARDTTPLALDRWHRLGLPAYGMVQDDGKVTIFAGAFERLEQAALLLPALRAAGVVPDLAYRTGRTY